MSQEAQVTRLSLTDEDKWIIIASDGIFGFVEEEAIWQKCSGVLAGKAQELADGLLKFAQDIGSKDNISVIAIELNIS